MTEENKKGIIGGIKELYSHFSQKRAEKKQRLDESIQLQQAQINAYLQRGQIYAAWAGIENLPEKNRKAFYIPLAITITDVLEQQRQEGYEGQIYGHEAIEKLLELQAECRKLSGRFVEGDLVATVTTAIANNQLKEAFHALENAPRSINKTVLYANLAATLTADLAEQEYDPEQTDTQLKMIRSCTKKSGDILKKSRYERINKAVEEGNYDHALRLIENPPLISIALFSFNRTRQYEQLASSIEGYLESPEEGTTEAERNHLQRLLTYCKKKGKIAEPTNQQSPLSERLRNAINQGDFAEAQVLIEEAPRKTRKSLYAHLRAEIDTELLKCYTNDETTEGQYSEAEISYLEDLSKYCNKRSGRKFRR